MKRIERAKESAVVSVPSRQKKRWPVLKFDFVKKIGESERVGGGQRPHQGKSVDPVLTLDPFLEV